MPADASNLKTDVVSADLKERLIAGLRADGFRMTPQREMIIDVFYHLPEGEHLSADELFQALVDRGSDISLATSYRTLKLLVSAGVLRELDFSEDHKHYELIRNPDEPPHHHIICTDCGKTDDLDSPEVLALAHTMADETNI
jgi:Fur family ferric uptake transcriptional regulator